MDWKGVFLCHLVFLCLAPRNVFAQYISRNLPRNCPCQSIALPQNIPANINLPRRWMPLAANVARNLPIGSNFAVTNVPTNLPIDNRIRLPNNIGCNCNGLPLNRQPIYNNPSEINSIAESIEKLTLITNLLSNLNAALTTYLPPTEKLSRVVNQAVAGQNIPRRNLNTPLGRLSVPIVNNIPIGALRVARNLPIANIAQGGIPNNVQIVGRAPVSYQNIAGVPINDIVRLPISNFGNIPINSYANLPINNAAILPQNMITRIPANNINLSLNNLGVPVDSLQRISVVDAGNVLANNIGNSPVNSLMALLQNNFANPTVNYVQRAPAANLPRYEIVNLPINNYKNLPRRRFVRLPRNNLPVSTGCDNKVLANVPVVPLNSLANLPAYNGLPVIKVSESVFKLTPVNS